MKKILLTALLGLGLSFQAQAQNNTSLFTEYSSQKGQFENDIDADMNGFGLGISSSPQKHGAWAKFEYQGNSDYDGDYYEISGGGHYNLINAGRYYAIGTLGVGVGVLDVEDFDSTAYLTIPVGLEAGINLNPNFSLYGGVGYKWAYEVSDDEKTRCNDGTTSNSSGSGTCSWHGGVNGYEYSNTIGDFDGVTYKVGVRYNF